MTKSHSEPTPLSALPESDRRTVEEIRERHAHDEGDVPTPDMRSSLNSAQGHRAHNDRAALLAILDRVARELAEARDEWGATLQRDAQALATEREARQQAEQERDQLRAARLAYASEFPPNADGDPDVGSIHENIRRLLARLVHIEALADSAAGALERAGEPGEARLLRALATKEPGHE